MHGEKKLMVTTAKSSQDNKQINQNKKKLKHINGTLKLQVELIKFSMEFSLTIPSFVEFLSLFKSNYQIPCIILWAFCWLLSHHLITAE